MEVTKLEDIDLTQYSHEELLKLTRRITSHVGDHAAWDTINIVTDTLAQTMRVEPSGMMVFAVRFDPDHRLRLDIQAFYPQCHTFDQLRKVALPLYAAISLHIGKIVPRIAKETGIGPAGFHELLVEEIRRQKDADGGGPVEFTLV